MFERRRLISGVIQQELLAAAQVPEPNSELDKAKPKVFIGDKEIPPYQINVVGNLINIDRSIEAGDSIRPFRITPEMVKNMPMTWDEWKEKNNIGTMPLSVPHDPVQIANSKKHHDHLAVPRNSRIYPPSALGPALEEAVRIKENMSKEIWNALSADAKKEIQQRQIAAFKFQHPVFDIASLISQIASRSSLSWQKTLPDTAMLAQYVAPAQSIEPLENMMFTADQPLHLGADSNDRLIVVDSVPDMIAKEKPYDVIVIGSGPNPYKIGLGTDKPLRNGGIVAQLAEEDRKALLVSNDPPAGVIKHHMPYIVQTPKTKEQIKKRKAAKAARKAKKK